MKEEAPKPIQLLAYNSVYKYSLLLWLDKKAYIEINDNDKPKFNRLLKRWEADNLPQLKRSDYRIYLSTKGKLELYEPR